MVMHTKISWGETITDEATEGHYFDLAQVFSHYNRKQYHQVDGKGNAQTYLVKITQSSHSGADQGDVRSILSTAPNTYVTKQAVKAWHKARVAMYSRIGVKMKSLSPYTRNLRMAMVNSVISGTEADSLPSSGTTNGELTSGVPELSTIVQAGQFDEANTGSLTGDDMVDTYTLTLLGDHVTQQTAETTKYTTVGVNQAWLDSRRTPYTLSDASVETGMSATSIQHGENPLFEVRAFSGIAEEVAAVAQDEQIQEPPWENATQTGLVDCAVMYTANNSTQEVILEVPCGLMFASIKDLRSTNAVTVNWTIELLDIYDM